MRSSLPRSAVTAMTALASLVVVFFVAIVPQSAPAEALSGGQFDPGLIISDANFYNGNAMTESQIQAFLASQVPSCVNGNCLAIKRTDTTTRVANGYCSQYDGAVGELTSTIIFKVQKACGISAKVILVTLQKEQSLVTATAPSDGQLERAMGYACPDTGQGCDPTYAGLYNQIYRAAWQFNRYGGSGFTWYPVGSPSYVRYYPLPTTSHPVDCGASAVTIKNKATAALYYYTPYQPNAAALANLYGSGDGCSSYGNRNFWRMYNDWFGTPTGPPGSPDGELSVVSSTYGAVSISGWAADPSDPAAAITISVQVDGAWYAINASEPLDSLATDYPIYGANHGFSGSYPVTPGAHTVCVYALNTGAGSDTSLGCTAFTAADGSPKGALTSVAGGTNKVTITGWVVDTDAVTTPVTLDIQVGAAWFTYVANASSAGTGAQFPGAGDSHGITFTGAVPPGTYGVCVYARNVGVGSAISLGCSTVAVISAPPVGAVTAATATVGGVSISGWAVDPDTLTTPVVVDVQVGPQWFVWTANGSTSLSEPAVPGSGTLHGFSGQVATPSGAQTICVYPRNTGNGPASSLGCTTVTVAQGTPTPVAPVGALQSVSGANGQVSISGWAVDADALTTPLMIDVQLDGWKSLTANDSNPAGDVAVPGAGANHGFAGSWTASAGPHTLCVYAKGQGLGGDLSLGCQTVTVIAPPSLPPAAALQSVTVAAGKVSISGWAVDADALTTPLMIDVQLDGWKSLTANASNPAGDVAVPGAGANHGFAGSWNLNAGTYTMCVYVKGQGGGGDTSLGCRSVVVPAVAGAAPVGALQSVSGANGQVSISGWAVDADALTTPLMIDVQLDGWKSLTANASNPAGDVAVPGAGANHGFAGSWNLNAGTYTMCVYVKGQGGGGDTSLGCRSVTVTAPVGAAPVGALEVVTGTGGQVAITGWAVDTDALTSALAVDVQLDGWKTLTANQTSAAAGAISGAGANHGFAGAWTLPAGTYTMCVYVKGQGGGGDTSLGCRSVTVTSAAVIAPVGALESVSGVGGKAAISGWAVDADSPLSTLTIDVQFNGWQWLAAGGANPASESAVAGSGTNHGFSGSWTIAPGTYPICVYAKGLGAGGDVALGCRQVTVTS